MIDRRWVPLGIRIVGLYVAGASAQGTLRAVRDIVQWVEYYKDSEHPGSVWPYVAMTVASGVPLVIGILLLVKATPLARRWVGEVSKRCPACLADIQAVVADACPECGGPIRSRAAINAPQP